MRSSLAGLALLGALAPAAPARATAHLSGIDPVIAGTSTTTTTSLYKFSALVGGKPVRWNPCAAIHWRLRTTALPTGVTVAAAYSVVSKAVARVASATGIPWKYDGATTATPTTSWLPTSTSHIHPVLIGWTDGAHSDLLAGRPAAVLGVTRTVYFLTTIAGKQLAATKSAVIGLDRTNRLPLTGAVSWRSVMLHELGHAMGLDHVSNTHELMNPVLQSTLRDLQYGDVLGLAKLGRSAGCLNLGF